MGTKFRIYFPRVEHRARKTSESDSMHAAIDLHGSETVLLVEDENAGHPACEFLKRCGYNVIEAKDGLEAVEAAARHKGRIDLMVTDVVMPGMSGGQLAEKVVLRHNILGMRTNFLQKPFTLKSLDGKVREVLGKASVAAGVAGD